MQTKHHRLLALLMTVVMTFQIIAIVPNTAFAEVTESDVVSGNVEQQIITETDEALVEDPPQLRATTGGKTVLAFTSDIHNGTASGGETNTGSLRLSTWLSKVQPMYNNIEVFGFCGDMAAASSNSSTFWTFTKTVMDNIDAHELTGVYAVGNHEYMNGEMASTSNSPAVREKYVLNGEARAEAGENYVIYCLGTNSSHGTSWAYDDSQITTLTNYLNSVGNDKVIIILTHFPLHDYGSHRTSNTLPVLNAINAAAAGADSIYGTSDDKKIVFLWGHNHSEGDNNYDQVWFPGDKINDNNKSTVNFYYAAAGCMADSEYGKSADVKGKGLVLEIDAQNKLAFTYYDANGNNVTEPNGQTITEQDPVAINGVTINAAVATVEVGKTIKLSYTKDPADATVKSATWTSSNTSVASVDSSGKVKGISAGTTTISLTINDGITRGTATASVDIEVTPRSGNGPMYVLTDDFEPGKNYIFANKNDGEAYALTNNNGTISATNVEIIDDVIYTDNEDIVFSAEGNGTAVTDLVNNEKYLAVSRSGSFYNYSYSVSLDSSARTIAWTYSSDHYLSSHYSSSSSSNIYVYYSNNNSNYSATNSTSSSSSSSPRELYLFEEVVSGSDPVSGVTLDKTALELKVGQSETLKATVSPATAANKSVEWSTSNSEVATVNNGLVTAVGIGKAVITVTTLDGGKTATCTVNVTESTASTYKLTDSLEDGAEYLIVNADAVGSAYALKNPGGSSAGTAIANSSNKTSVTIQSGTEKYIETENTDIVWTATANGNGFNLTNGTDYLEGASGDVSVFNPQKYSDRYWTYSTSNHYLQHNGGQNTYTLRYNSSSNYFQSSTSTSSSYTVYLFKKEAAEDVPVTGISLNKNTLRLSVGENETLIVTFTPADSSHKTVDWSSNNPSVAVVSNGVVTAMAAGTTTITATSADGPSANCVVTVTAAQTVTYSLTDKLEAGKEYLIATSNNGSAFILSSEAGAVSNSLKGYSVSVANGSITIPAAYAEKTVFECVQNPSSTDTNYVRLMNSGKYLYADSSGALRMADSISDNGKNWHYRDADKYVLWFYNGSGGDYGYTATDSYKYYLEYDNDGNFTKGTVQTSQLANANTPKIYIFEKSEQQSAGGECTIAVTASKSEVLPGETVTFTVTLLGPVSNFGSMNMELDIPAGLSYVTGTGKLADNLRQTLGFDEALDDGMGVFFDENTLMISGCGTKNYSSQDDTVLATFDCTINNSFSGPATVTLKEELEVGDVENWVLLEASAIGADITLHVHEWEVSWNWTGSDASGYTAAAATIACKKDPTHTQTVTTTVETSTPSSGEDAGYTVYTATVTAANSPDGTAHTDKKRVPITYTISYELDGGSVATANPTAYTVESDPITLNNPTKTGCTFLGWTGTGLGSATTTVTIAKGSTGDRSYTATWRVDGYEISGNITSYIGLNPDIPDYVYEEGKVSVVLYAEGSENVVATAVVSDDNKTYTLTGIANGTYDLKVTKKDHAPRTYTISVSDGAVTQDVIIRLYGDMNGDGKLTTYDAGRINSHAQGKGLLEDYDLIVADVLGPNGVPDGEVSTADAGRVNSHVMAGKLLW